MVDIKRTLDIYEGELQPLRRFGFQAKEKLEQWASGEKEGFSTGFADLDRYFRLIDGELVVIAAMSSMGKTALGMQMVEHIAEELERRSDPGCVAIYSAEMSGWSLLMRLATAMAGTNMHKLRMGAGTPDELTQTIVAVERLQSLPIWINEVAAPTTETMQDQLIQLNEDQPVRAMLFDYLELGGNRATSENLRVAAIATSLRDIAKTMSIPVIVLSQVNKDANSRATRMPGLDDLRYSAGVGHAADVVTLLMRPEYYAELGVSVVVDDPGDLEGVAYIEIAKNRQGPRGRIKLAWIGDRFKFGNLARNPIGGVA